MTWIGKLVGGEDGVTEVSNRVEYNRDIRQGVAKRSLVLGAEIAGYECRLPYESLGENDDSSKRAIIP